MSIPPSCRLSPLFLLVLFMPVVFSFLLLPFIDSGTLDALRIGKKHSEFVKHLGIPNEGLLHPDKDENMEPMFNEELAFGDLLMDEEEMEDTEDDEEDDEEDDANDVEDDFVSGGTSPKRKSKKSVKKPKTWPKGIIPYYISKDFNKVQKQKIESAIEEMNRKLRSVYFRPVEKSDRNYVIIFNGKGCYAKLGMKGGQQPVSLQADKCLQRGTIQHELLHILGFRHEQNRPDRNYYVEILYNNIPKRWQKDYKRYKSSQAHSVGEYDYLSVLHYPPQAPSSQGRKYAFRILDEDVDIQQIGNRKGMSDADIQKVEELYSNES